MKNEGDVIEAFVRHNLLFLDALTIVDNASFDGTREILEALREEGLPLTVTDDPTLQKRQSERSTAFARRSTLDDDWDFLFFLDADEFLKAIDRESLERSLRALPPGHNGLLGWQTYVPDDSGSDAHVFARIASRRACELPVHHKIVLSRSFASDGIRAIDQGSHDAVGDTGARRSTILEGVSLAHLPVRSVAQIQGRMLVGWGGYLTMGYEHSGLGWHQRELFERLERGEAWTVADLQSIALVYATEPGASVPDALLVHDPMHPIPILRYGNRACAGALQIAARYVRQLAGNVARGERTGEVPL